ncbi:hypothetical protein F5887DRAFT_107068 [Amanita rubescens]|nr:hypothetical protein F5887DRAFT_107068 [Amanita rubescens]
MIRVTFLLLFLPCFFSVTTYADVFITSPYEPLELPGQGFYDTSVQPARPQALVEWNPHKVTSGSRSVTVLKSLIVKVEGPKVVTRVEELILTTTITNSGSETLRLIKEPSGILYSHLPTKRFHIAHSTGVIPQFKGVQVEFSLREAIKSGHLTRLAPGQSISVEHDLSEAYDFTVSGFGRYHFKPRNRFFIVNSVTKRVTMVQASSTQGTSVDWSGRLVARGSAQSSLKLNEKICIDCSAEQIETIHEIAVFAEMLVVASLNYFKSFPKDTARYCKYFGALLVTRTRLDQVKSRFEQIYELLHTVPYKCMHSQLERDRVAGVPVDYQVQVALYPAFFDGEKSMNRERKISKVSTSRFPKTMAHTTWQAGEIISVLSEFAGTRVQTHYYSEICVMVGPNGYKHMENGERDKWLDKAVNHPDAYQHFAESFAEVVRNEQQGTASKS